MNTETTAQPADTLTFPKPLHQPDPVIHDCSGYTCEHPLCSAEREHRVTHLTGRPKRTRQPWETAA